MPFCAPKVDYLTIRYNEIRDLTASLLTEVYHKVQIEPTLQPLSGESFDHATLNKEDGASLDVSMNSFWGVDVKIIY